GQMLATLGLDPMSDKPTGYDLAAIRSAITASQQRWDALAKGGDPAAMAPAQPGPTLAAAASRDAGAVQK
ncbi:TPA: TolC family protein, partial [Burkholderia vietnamiensis]|nr:TolC family protein [Burkholderia vietnamiensis]